MNPRVKVAAVLAACARREAPAPVDIDSFIYFFVPAPVFYCEHKAAVPVGSVGGGVVRLG